jgi:hypothetical protein
MATRIGPLLTVADLELMPDDGNRYELLEGELIVSRAPRLTHQRISGKDLIVDVQRIAFIDPLRLFRPKEGFEGQRVGPHMQPGDAFHRGWYTLAPPFICRAPAALVPTPAPRRSARTPFGRRQDAPTEEAVLLQALETLRTQIRANVWEPVHGVGKAARAGHQLTDDEQRPAFSDDIQGVGEPTVLVVPSTGHTTEYTNKST